MPTPRTNTEVYLDAILRELQILNARLAGTSPADGAPAVVDEPLVPKAKPAKATPTKGRTRTSR